MHFSQQHTRRRTGMHAVPRMPLAGFPFVTVPGGQMAHTVGDTAPTTGDT